MTAKPLMAMHRCSLLAPRLDKWERGAESVSETFSTMLSTDGINSQERNWKFVYDYARISWNLAEAFTQCWYMQLVCYSSAIASAA